MSFAAKVLAHSVSPYSDVKPLFTMQLRYPRFIHAEELTHRILNTSPEQVETVTVPDGVMYDRDLSRNASSSRAIPVPRLVEDIRRDPAEPIFWGKNQPGMQAAEELTGPALNMAKDIWKANRETCLRDALDMHNLGASKQLVNRLIENHGHINIVVTATNWSNFFALRRHEAAMPEIRHLADLIWEAQQASIPHILGLCAWHLPYVDEDEEFEAVQGHVWARHEAGEFSEDGVAHAMGQTLIRLSVARCARVSYLTTEGAKPTLEADLALYDRLVGSIPRHASPAEHQAQPDWRVETIHRSGRGRPLVYPTVGPWERPNTHGNLAGWVQYRKTLTNECA